MTSENRPDNIEFIRLGGHAVRVTSWTVGEDEDTFTLVTITRGSRDAELLSELLANDRVVLEIPGKVAMDVHAASIDRRDIGEGQSAISRFSVVLTTSVQAPTTPPRPPELSLDERVAVLESEIAELRTTVRQLANDR